jgi:hypothetical protein
MRGLGLQLFRGEGRRGSGDIEKWEASVEILKIQFMNSTI